MAQTMTVRFEGFWQCRLSTDPDPTREPRGTSGYTFALPGEPDFDRVIRTQKDRNVVLRKPFPPYLEAPKQRFGVFVTEVDGAPSRTIAQALEGAPLRLMNEPVFELRNQIVGDGINRIAPPIVPFDLLIGTTKQPLLRRSDPLDPTQPDKQIWELEPDDFAPRVPVTYRHLSDEVVETIFPGTGVGEANASFIAYFNRRKQWLTAQLSWGGLSEQEATGYRIRVDAIDAFTSAGTGSDPGLMEDRLGLQCIWDHPVRGHDARVAPALQRFVDLEHPWHTRFWMGGWDGDTLLGWMKGQLSVPLRSSAKGGASRSSS
jgi:hypothetical protein